MTAASSSTKTREVVVTRIFDAPVDLVWKCWTEPEYITKWWGPQNFTAPTIENDLRVGGKYLYCMRGVGLDGVMRDAWNIGEYREIIPHARIVTDMRFADGHGNPVPASYYGLPGEWPDR